MTTFLQINNSKVEGGRSTKRNMTMVKWHNQFAFFRFFFPDQLVNLSKMHFIGLSDP